MPLAPSFPQSGEAAHGHSDASITTRPQRHENFNPRPVAYRARSPHVRCPCCSGSVIRIWRRPGDRILSMVTPLHRYRCESHDCRWEGNIRRPRSRVYGNGRTSGTPRGVVSTSFVVHMALVVVGVVIVFAMARTDWFLPKDNMMSDAQAEFISLFSERPSDMRDTRVSATSSGAAVAR